MDDRFYNGVIGCATTICGYKVDALTPWHHVLLSAIDSPILNPSKDSELDDLLIFLKVTQSSWPDVPDFKPTISDQIWLLRMKLAKTAGKEMAKLKEWLAVQLSTPKLWQNEDQDGQRRSTTPNMLMLVVGLVNSCNISLSEAWNMRNSEAQWYNIAVAEINGASLRLVDENEPMPEPVEMSEDEILQTAKDALRPAEFERFKKARKELLKK